MTRLAELAALFICGVALVGCTRTAARSASAESVDTAALEARIDAKVDAKIEASHRKCAESRAGLPEQLKLLEARIARLETNVATRVTESRTAGIAARAEQVVDKITTEAIAPKTTSPTPAVEPSPVATPAKELGASDVREVSDLGGRMGRLVIKFPENTKTSGASVRVFVGETPTGDASISKYGNCTADLMPGFYSVEISGRNAGVFEVKSRHETRVHTGVLRLTLSSGTSVSLYAPGAASHFQSLYGSHDVALPVGDTEVSIAGRRERVTIQRDEIKEF